MPYSVWAKTGRKHFRRVQRLDVSIQPASSLFPTLEAALAECVRQVLAGNDAQVRDRLGNSVYVECRRGPAELPTEQR